MDTSSRSPSASDWLTGNLDLLARERPVLDVASGRGRQALRLAAAGFAVHAVDRDAAALASLREQAERLGATIETSQIDLETSDVDLGTSATARFSCSTICTGR